MDTYLKISRLRILSHLYPLNLTEREWLHTFICSSLHIQTNPSHQRFWENGKHTLWPGMYIFFVRNRHRLYCVCGSMRDCHCCTFCRTSWWTVENAAAWLAKKWFHYLYITLTQGDISLASRYLHIEGKNS